MQVVAFLMILYKTRGGQSFFNFCDPFSTFATLQLVKLKHTVLNAAFLETG